jgi:hypothetical protein
MPSAIAKQIALPLGGPGQAVLVLDAAGPVESRERDGAALGAHLDDDPPLAVVDADLGLRPPPAQARYPACLFGGELERHAITIGMNAEAPNKVA